MESMMSTATMGAMPSSTGMADSSTMDMGMGGCKISVSSAVWFEEALQLIPWLDDVELVHYRLVYVFVPLQPFQCPGHRAQMARPK
jgi:hypothetical protein